MTKIKPEKIAGIVALSYLILIPAAATYAWLKIQAIDRDVSEMWDRLDMPPTQARPVMSIENLKNMFK